MCKPWVQARARVPYLAIYPHCSQTWQITGFLSEGEDRSNSIDLSCSDQVFGLIFFKGEGLERAFAWSSLRNHWEAVCLGIGWEDSVLVDTRQCCWGPVLLAVNTCGVSTTSTSCAVWQNDKKPPALVMSHLMSIEKAIWTCQCRGF